MCITATHLVLLSVTHVGITNEEMGEAGPAARSVSEIELISILALDNADARWRARAMWVQ